MLAQATSSIRNENESLHNLQGKTKAQKQRMKPFVSIWKLRRISLWMKFSICLRTDIWDGWVLSGHQLAAPSPHFWSFDPRFSRKTESHPYLLEGKAKVTHNGWNCSRQRICGKKNFSGMNGQRSEEVRRQQQQLLEQVNFFLILLTSRQKSWIAQNLPNHLCFCEMKTRKWNKSNFAPQFFKLYMICVQ